MSMVAYSVSEYQEKYLMQLKNISGINISKNLTATNDNIREHFLHQNVITNSYFGFKTPAKLLINSTYGKIITFSHSTFGSIDNYLNCIPKFKNEFFAMPFSWKNILKYTGSNKNIFGYNGHFMSMYHYNNRQAISQDDSVLYLPVSGIDHISQVEKNLKNITGRKIYIKVHPITELNGNYPKNWPEDSKGITLDDYIDFAKRDSRVTILPPKTSLMEAMDNSRYLILTPPTSCIIESAIRSKIYSQNKRIVCTSNLEGIPQKYGMNYSSSPNLSDFGFVSDETINELVIGKDAQIESIKNVLFNILNKTGE